MTFAFKCSNEAISDFFHLFILEKKLKREQGFNIAAMSNGTLDIFFKKGGGGRFQLQQIQTFKILFYDLNKTAFHILQINILVLYPPPQKKNTLTLRVSSIMEETEGQRFLPPFSLQNTQIKKPRDGFITAATFDIISAKKKVSQKRWLAIG